MPDTRGPLRFCPTGKFPSQVTAIHPLFGGAQKCMDIRGAKFEKESGEIQGIDLQPASLDIIHSVATGAIPVITSEEEDGVYTPVVIRTKSFDAEWMTVEEAVDRMELVGHDFFLFIDARSDHPSVVYRRKGWDYGVIALSTLAAPAELAS